jgi:hypothetical protein
MESDESAVLMIAGCDMYFSHLWSSSIGRSQDETMVRNFSLFFFALAKSLFQLEGEKHWEVPY